jgi:hypothetical protein
MRLTNNCHDNDPPSAKSSAGAPAVSGPPEPPETPSGGAGSYHLWPFPDTSCLEDTPGFPFGGRVVPHRSPRLHAQGVSRRSVLYSCAPMGHVYLPSSPSCRAVTCPSCSEVGLAWRLCPDCEDAGYLIVPPGCKPAEVVTNPSVLMWMAMAVAEELERDPHSDAAHAHFNILLTTVLAAQAASPMDATD